MSEDKPFEWDLPSLVERAKKIAAREAQFKRDLNDEIEGFMDQVVPQFDDVADSFLVERNVEGIAQ